MNFTFLDHKPVFDINGDIRWYSTSSTLQSFTHLENGHYLFTYTIDDEPNNVVMEEDLLGKIYAIYNIPDGVQHDFAELPNGNLLATTQDPASKTIEDSIIEIDRTNGDIVRSFDLKNYLDDNRQNEIGLSPLDWLHINSIVYDTNDQSIIFSSRAQSAVIKMSYPSMKIQWILGPHDHWTSQYQPYLLNPVGDNFEWQWSQHDASILSEGNINGDEIIDILLFDNGNYRSFDVNTALSPEDSYSRIVLYQIDETNRTVKQLWEYGKERGSDLFSISRGSAYLLGNGNYLGDWAEIVTGEDGSPIVGPSNSITVHSEIIEVDPSNNQVVFEARINAMNYRTFRANLYDGYSVDNTGLSTKLNDTTTMDLAQEILP